MRQAVSNENDPISLSFGTSTTDKSLAILLTPLVCFWLSNSPQVLSELRFVCLVFASQQAVIVFFRIHPRYLQTACVASLTQHILWVRSNLNVVIAHFACIGMRHLL